MAKSALPESPSADTIRGARLEAGLTQQQASDLIYVTIRSWQSWEQGWRQMPPGLWKFFLLLTDPKLQDCLKDWR
jgi:DNA-binding transcriptional regulator YiaG